MLLDEGGTRPASKDTPDCPFALLVVPALLAGIAAESRAVAQPPVRFTRLAANFELRDGVASTSDLHLDGDAEILVRARVGLRGPRLRRAKPSCCAARSACRRRCAASARRRRWRPPGWRCGTGWPAAGSERSRIALRLRGTWEDPIVSAQ